MDLTTDDAGPPPTPVSVEAEPEPATPTAPLHQSGTSHPQGASARETPHLTSAFGQPDVTRADFADRLSSAVRFAHQTDRQLRIRLSPPELGTLQIEVTSTGGTLSARLEVHSSSAQHAILEHLPQLRESLGQHGATLDRIDVQLVESSPEESPSQFSHHGNPERHDEPSSREQLDDWRDERGSQFGPSDSPQDPPAVRPLDELDIQV